MIVITDRPPLRFKSTRFVALFSKPLAHNQHNRIYWAIQYVFYVDLICCFRFVFGALLAFFSVQFVCLFAFMCWLLLSYSRLNQIINRLWPINHVLWLHTQPISLRWMYLNRIWRWPFCPQLTTNWRGFCLFWLRFFRFCCFEAEQWQLLRYRKMIKQLSKHRCLCKLFHF